MLSTGALAIASILGAGAWLQSGHRAGDMLGTSATERPFQDERNEMAELANHRLETERARGGLETRNVWRVAAARAGGGPPYRSSGHRVPRVNLNRPLTREEELQCRSYYAQSLDETKRLHGLQPLNGDRDLHGRRQRGLGAYHPGLTRLERGSGMPLPPTSDYLPGRYEHYLEDRRLRQEGPVF